MGQLIGLTSEGVTTYKITIDYNILVQTDFPRFWLPDEIFGGSLEWPYALHLAFCPQILRGGGGLQIIFLLENECSLSGVNTQTLLAVKNVCTLGQWEHKNFENLPAPQC